MALGGGNFTTQNKVLPGSYINFMSISKASANLSERGFVTMPLTLDWGIENEIFTVTNAEFIKNSKLYFGYDYTHDKLKGLRDLFLNIHTLYAYRLNGGTKASNNFATAKYSGIRGNDLVLVITNNVDDITLFDVSTFLDTSCIETQTVANSAELIDNDYVVFDKTVTLELTAGIPFEGGANDDVIANAHQEYLDIVESYAFNIMAVSVIDDTIKQLYVNYTKRMRDEVGAKFQLVVHNNKSDYEGVINVKNVVTDVAYCESDLVYWVAGIQSGCAINKSCLNKSYNGEFSIECKYTQEQLCQAIADGEFVMHKVANEVRVLADINSLVSVTTEKGEDFKENQVIRVLDQIANDIASLFNTKYLGLIPNDDSGRISLWADIVKHHESLQTIRAIENFSSNDVEVYQGDTKKSVVISDYIQVVNTMAQIYMTVQIS